MCYLISPKYLTVSDETDSASHVRVVISGLIGDELEVLLTTVVDVDHAALGCSGSRISEERVDKVGVVVAFKKNSHKYYICDVTCFVLSHVVRRQQAQQVVCEHCEAHLHNYHLNYVNYKEWPKSRISEEGVNKIVVAVT